jgi:hypothetical protein
MYLEWLGDNQPAIFAHTSCVLNELDLQSLINYCIALKEVLQGRISPLGFCNFLLLEGIFQPLHCDLQTLHSYESSRLALACCSCCSYANGAQMISIVACSIPLVPHQTLHGCTHWLRELGIIVKSQNCIRYCIRDPFYVYYFRGLFLQ